MMIRWRNLSGEFLEWTGAHAWHSEHATVLVTLSRNVTLNGKPMSLMRPHLCRAAQAYILDSRSPAICFVVYLPHVNSFRIGDFEIG